MSHKGRYFSVTIDKKQQPDLYWRIVKATHVLVFGDCDMENLDPSYSELFYHHVGHVNLSEFNERAREFEQDVVQYEK